jgi:small neutral amino acid transporter SnatA (MarC family)
MRGLFSILPMAIVMIAGPQLISAVVLVTGTGSRRNSLAYIAGVFLATMLGVSLVFFLAGLAHNETHSSSSSSGKNAINYAVIALLVVLAVRVYRRRGESEPPKWMMRRPVALCLRRRLLPSLR